MIAVTIKNAGEIKRAFAKSPFLMTRELNKSIERVVYKISRDSRKFTPVDTGRLRSSTYERTSNLKGEIGTNTKYDIFVHDGTRFQRAQPYLKRAVEKNQPFVDREFKRAVDNVLRKIAK